MAEPLTIRVVAQLGPDELPAVRTLIDVAREHDGVEAIGEHKFLRVSAGGASGVKALLAYEGTRLAGYANVETFPVAEASRLAAEMVVHPDARGRGVASRMLEEIIAEARRLEVDRVDMWAYRQLPGTRKLAAKFGFEEMRTLLEVKMPLPDSLPEAPLPDGVELRAFVPGRDDAEWLALNNQVFATHPEQGNWDEADLAARLTQPWFAAQDFLVAFAEGRMVAYNWLKLDFETKEGEIYVIGVDANFRRRHFGRSLSIRGLDHMRKRGMTHAAAYVDAENANALAMYYSLGFELDHSDLCYSKPLKERRPV
jgi:mycothiol synthase